MFIGDIDGTSLGIDHTPTLPGLTLGLLSPPVGALPLCFSRLF